MIRSISQFRCNACRRICKRTAAWSAVDGVCGRCYRTQCMMKGRHMGSKITDVDKVCIDCNLQSSESCSHHSSKSSSSYCDNSDCSSSDDLTFDSDGLSDSDSLVEAAIMDARYSRGDWFKNEDSSLCSSEKEMVRSSNTAETEPETPSDDDFCDADLTSESSSTSTISEIIESGDTIEHMSVEKEPSITLVNITNLSSINRETGNADTDIYNDECTKIVHTEVICENCCINCKRHSLSFDQINGDALECRVLLTDVKVGCLNFRKCITWRTFTRKDISKCREVKLCTQCSFLFTNTTVVRKKAGWDMIWPSYIWKLLIFEEPDVPGCHRLIRAIPHQWLKYWYKSLKALGRWPPENSEVVTLDVTVEKREFMKITKDLKLGELKNGCDRLLMPKILCPWGCTSYLHHKGSVSFDAIISRYFLNVPFAGSQCSETAYYKVKSARGDFFSGTVDMHLHNPEWSVHPSVAFVEGEGPVFLTCQEHDGGTKDLYFHLPKTGSSLPSARSDYLSHAVLRSRTLKTSKAHQYSNSYQLNKCTAGYCGIDTCYVSDSRHFDFQSHLTEMNECRSYAGREDIRGLVSRLRESGSISDDLASDYIERSEAYFSDSGRMDSLCSGGTMMTLRDTMNLQKLLHEPQIIEIQMSQNTTKTLHIKRMWPLSRIYIHTVDGYGSAFLNIGRMASAMNVCDYRLLWTTCLALVSVSTLWEAVAANATSCDDWHGHILAFLSKKVINHAPRLSPKEGNPFDVNAKGYKCKPEDLHSRLQNWCLQRFALSPIEFSEFRAHQMANVFDKEVCGGIISFIPLPHHISIEVLEEKSGSVCESVQAIMFYRVGGQRSTCDGKFDGIYVNGFYFELRFMSSTALEKEKFKARKKKVSTPPKKKNKIPDPEYVYKWNGCCYARHGTSVFGGWWQISRGGVRSQATKIVDLDILDWGNMDLFILVKCNPVSLDAVRKEYLKYIGGQCSAICSMHDTPLIITSRAKEVNAKTCVSVGCQKDEKFMCPVPLCTNCICNACFKAIPAGEVVFVGGHIRDSNIEATGEVVIRPRGMNNEIVDSAFVDTSTDTESTGESTVSSNDDMFCGFDIANLPTGEEIPIANIEDESLMNNSETKFDALLPTTHSSALPMNHVGEFGYMGSSVLLNKCGTMLVRRHTQLQASRRERNLIERVVSVPDIGTVPLLYLEGILFPSIFWHLPHSSGGILGSIPTALFCQHETRKQFNVASIADHAKTRLKSIGNTASTDPRYLSFIYDSLANGAIEGQDTRVVLSRGFEESMGPAGLRLRNKDDDFLTDTIDNRQNVHNLCASEKENPSTFFLTLTCNQREHFGIKNIKRYVDSCDSLQNYLNFHMSHHPKSSVLSEYAKNEVRMSLQEAARNLIVRNWMEVRLLLISYLMKSPEKPLGDVLKLFARDEYQNDVGNLSHLHMLIALRSGYDDIGGRKQIQSLVRGYIDEIIGVDEVDACIKEGILESWEDYREMKDQARKFLSHQHSQRCMRRSGVGSDDLVCRVPDPRLLSKDLDSFYEVKLDIEHSNDAMQVMERIGLIQDRTKTGGQFEPLHDFLKAKRIIPPARLGEGNISPVIGRLFAATRSQMNVQICTSFGTSRYIVKYLIKIDENNYVVFSGNKDDRQSSKAEVVHLHNTKITSSAINESKKLNIGRDKKKPKGRKVAVTEEMQLILGFPQVFTNVESIKVSTLPLAERAGFERISPSDIYDQLEDNGVLDNELEEHDAFSFMFPNVEDREKMFRTFSPGRCHTASQVIMLRDQMESRVSLDRVFVFGIRPPELLLIDKLEWFYRFFERSKSRVTDNKQRPFSSFVKRDLCCSAWIDGLGHRLRLRPAALPILREILRDPDVRNESIRKGLTASHDLLVQICELWMEAGITVGNDAKPREGSTMLRATATQWKHLQHLFVAHYLGDKPLPIPVFSNVKPFNAPRFVIHILLSMGHFETESDLWTTGSMKEAFQKGRLLPENIEIPTLSMVDEILKGWILEQLRFYPIGSKQMDEYIVAASNIFKSTICDGEIPIDELPPYLYTTLLQDTSDKVMSHMKDCKDSLISATLNTFRFIYPNDQHLFPSHAQLSSATKANPLNWDGHLPITSKQSQASYDEQLVIQQQAMQAVNKYISSNTKAAKNYAIAGPPGAGKTHCMAHSIIYALSKGLYGMTTAVLADRAFLLGGQHFHKLFKLKVRDKGTPHRLAELAIIALQKHPEFLALLRYLDVLFVDELGQLSASMVAVLDLVMRKIRNSSLFMGGLLIVGTIDQCQLRPIKGLPFLLSPFVLTTFSMGLLKIYVRCAECKHLQSMNEIARLYTNDMELRDEKLRVFEDLVRNHCTFVDSWSDKLITEEVLSIFPKRWQTTEATERFLDSKKQESLNNNLPFFTRQSEDSMVGLQSHSDWQSANKVASDFLNSKTKEPATLQIYEGAIYEFTFNKPGCFNATQLGVILDMPPLDDLLRFKDIEIWVAPPGTKMLGTSALQKDDMIAAGWRRTKVGTKPEHPFTLWTYELKVRRKQYGMKLHVSSTIHSAIGHSLNKIATEFAKGSKIWEKAMVVVLISRVSNAKDLIFVGDKEQNIRALVDGLRVRDQYDEYMNHVVDVLTNATSSHPSQPLVLSNHPFRPKDIQLPQDKSGIVYMLVSAQDARACYVGYTQNMEKRLKSHNSGLGSKESCDPAKRPWALFAYVVGFVHDRDKMRRFEKKWQETIKYQRPSDPFIAASFAQEMISRDFRDEGLLLVVSSENSE